MTNPIPRQQPSHPPEFHHFPDPQHKEDMSRLGDEITEMAAHLTAGNCQLLELIQVFDEEGEPLNIGRKTRSIPPAIRRALKRRDAGCRFPGCTCSTRFVDAHHIQHWADCGETSMDNLVLLCRRHHRLVHEEGFGLNRGADGAFNFTLPNGTLIPSGPDQRFRGNFVVQKVKNSEMGLEITSDTPIPKWCGETMDNDLAVLGLLQRE